MTLFKKKKYIGITIWKTLYMMMFTVKCNELGIYLSDIQDMNNVLLI